MISKLQRVFGIGILLLIQGLCFAQKVENPQFLIKAGIVDSLYSETLNEFREIYIQFPANYSPQKHTEYPVVYILDGENLLSTVHNVQNFYSGGFTPDMILVGISNANNRTRDLTTSKMTEMYGSPYSIENGEADNFSKFLAVELIPFIETKYPVTSFRTLIGHSYGGLFSIYMLLNHPQLFSNYLAIDPSLDWDHQKLLTEAEEILSKRSFEGKSLFVSLSGQLHMQNPNITIDNVMEDSSEFTLFPRSILSFVNAVKKNSKNGLFFDWKFYPNDLHGTIPLPSIMDGLISVFKWYQMENTDKINSFETSSEELLKIIKYREQKLKNHFGYLEPPYPEEILIMIGNMSLDMNQPEKAKMYFELAIEYFSKSGNAYNSMSKYYEKTNDYENALKFSTKAFQLNPTDFNKQRMETLMKNK